MKETIYPVTITKDRMNGAYCGDVWIAWPCEEIFCLDVANGGDQMQQEFWGLAKDADIKKFIGFGRSPEDAYHDLWSKVVDLEHTTDTANYEIFKRMKEQGYDFKIHS